MRKFAEDLWGVISLMVVVFALVCSVKLSGESWTEERIIQAQETGGDALEAFRAEREQVREIEVLQLSSIAQDESADQDIRNEARRELIALSGYMEMESTIEGVLSARGLEKSVVTVHANSVNVLVPKDEISLSESAMILELAMRETGQTGGNVKIMTVGKRDE